MRSILVHRTLISMSVPHSIAQGPASQRRRRLAAWLLLGWAMFWLAGMMPWCGTDLGGLHATAGQQVLADGSIPPASRHDNLPVYEGCCAVTDASTHEFSVASSTTDPFKSPSGSALAPSPLSSAFHPKAVIWRNASVAPLSGAESYLRHRRLLI